MKVFRRLLIYILLMALIFGIAYYVRGNSGIQAMTYSEFYNELLQEKNVDTIVAEGGSARVKLKEAKNGGTLFRVDYYSDTEFELLVQRAIDQGIDVEYAVNVSNLTEIIISVIPYVLLVGALVFFMVIMSKGSAGGAKAANFGKSRARLYTSSKIKFEDVAGAEEEKEEMAELVSFLKDPKRYADMGARIPKGVLMVGPPGTGKTYLAKAVAGEANVPFFSISGSDFVEMYVGVGASRVRDLFEQAKKTAPCIIFIDEIDAVGRHRGAGLGGGHDEREQTLNQLLVEMDGFAGNEGIIVIAATNRPDILDPALTRPGRFDRKILVNTPTLAAREQILITHARRKPLAEDADLHEVAKITPGFTPADLENLLNEAALLAARECSGKIFMRHIKEATFRVIVGHEKKSHVMTEDDKRLTAIHETGHAIAVKYASKTDTVDRVSIIPAGLAGGYTVHKPNEDKSYTTKSQLISKIIIALGGRAAEEICLGEVSTGASSDLHVANEIAHDMIQKYGMSETLTNLIFEEESNEVFIGRDIGHARNFSEETAKVIDDEVKKIIDDAYAKTLEILNENRAKLDRVVAVLMDKEKIEGEEFELLMEDAE